MTEMTKNLVQNRDLVCALLRSRFVCVVAQSIWFEVLYSLSS